MAKRNESPLDKILGTVNTALDRVPGRSKPASGIEKVTERLRSLTGGKPKQNSARRGAATRGRGTTARSTPARKTAATGRKAASTGRKTAGTGGKAAAAGRKAATGGRKTTKR
jgi:hypothetical protein